MDERPCHTLTVEETAEKQNTDLENGLSRKEVRRRQQQYGFNKLRQAKKLSWFTILVDQFKTLVVLLLVIAAGIAFAVGNQLEGAAIAAVIFLNAGIGFVVELKATRAMESLQRLGVQDTVTLRDGKRTEINAQQLVPGDVVEFEAGDSITADCRLVEASNFRVVESALTGESVPIEKATDAIADENLELGDRTNMVFKGTSAVTGSARAIITATGMKTEMGKIAELITEQEEEETPLELRLRRLGRQLIVIVIVIAAIVIGVGILRGKSTEVMFLTGIALAIAAVPEGLPAVATISLAIGMRRMAARNALIRKLPAVETLGSATVVCTDKTGTLTENEMTAVKYHLADGPVVVTGSGYTPEGEFKRDNKQTSTEHNEPLRLALICGTLCNNASLTCDEDSEKWEITGDPTEAALVVSAAKAGLDQNALRDEYEEIKEHPFSSETARMATQHEAPEGGMITFAKGAPSSIFAICNSVLTPDGAQPFDNEHREQWEQAQQSMTDEALRVLALAYKKEDGEQAPYENLTLLGLVGLLDPPREEVAGAIKEFKDAGIRTVMITGDHPRTAYAIGNMLGIPIESRDAVIAGNELNEMTKEELADRVDDISVYARVSPEDKLKIVDALQDKGNVVAMLGDGVNDAAALKAADIGVAMGIEGTDVAIETSEIVLLDDRFLSVVAAAEEGRLVLENIQKFIRYLFSCNVSEIVTVLVGTVAGLPLPLFPLQILWINLVTEVFLALSLAAEPPEGDLMDRPPRPINQPLFSRRVQGAVAGYGILIAVVTLGAFLWGLNREHQFAQTNTARPIAQTIAFTTIVFAQLLNSWTLRRAKAPFTSLKQLISNRWMIGATALTILLQLAAIYLPGLSRVLRTQPLTAIEIGIVFALAFIVLIVGQAVRWTARWRKTT